MAFEIEMNIFINLSNHSNLKKCTFVFVYMTPDCFQNKLIGGAGLVVLHFLFLHRFRSVCRFKSLSYYRHLAASPSFGRADS